MVKIEPHDLLRINSTDDLSGDNLPDWAKTIFPRSLTVVVRRSPVLNSQIPVGIRGIKREQRFATYIEAEVIQKIITPFDLVKQRAWNGLSERRRILPAIEALPKVAGVLHGYDWGISGSVGFELATQTESAKVTSDLDLVWKPKQVISKEAAQDLLKKLNQFKVHADLQVIQGTTGFSLEEYANSRSTILLKTLNDPILVRDPWVKR